MMSSYLRKRSAARSAGSRTATAVKIAFVALMTGLPACEAFTPNEDAGPYTRVDELTLDPVEKPGPTRQIVGHTFTMTATAYQSDPSRGSVIINGPMIGWTSSNPSVVQVLDDAQSESQVSETDETRQRLRAVSVGTATITATLKAHTVSNNDSFEASNWGHDTPLTTTFTVSVLPAPASVRFEPASPTVQVGQQGTVKIVLLDASGVPLPDELYYFSLSCLTPTIAAAGESGICSASGSPPNRALTFRGVAPGTGRFSYTLSRLDEYASQFSGTLNVNVTPVASRLEFRPPGSTAAGTLNLFVSESKSYQAVAVDAQGNAVSGATGLTYRLLNSADGNTLTINPQTGVVTGLPIAGTSRDVPVAATATFNGQTLSGEGLVHLSRRVQFINLSPPGLNGFDIEVGQGLQLTGIPEYVTGAPTTPAASVTFVSSSVPAVASVSPTGFISGLTPGVTTVRVSSESQVRDFDVRVAVRPAATSIDLRVVTTGTSTRAIDPPETIAQGATIQFAATVKDQLLATMPNETVTWSSANSSIASVNSATGVVKGESPGTTQIVARSTSNPNVLAGVSITVTGAPAGPPVSIVMDPVDLTTTPGTTARFTARLLDAQGRTTTAAPGMHVTYIAFLSSVADNEGANIENGNFRAKSVGATHIIAQYLPVGGGTATMSAQSTLRVVSPTGAFTVKVTPTHVPTTVGATGRFTAEVRDINGNIVQGQSLLWSSSNEAAVTVNSSTGDWTARANGGALITAEVLTGNSVGAAGHGNVTVGAAGAVVASVSTVSGSSVLPAVGAAGRAYQAGVLKGTGYMDASSDTPGRLYIPGLVPGTYSITISLAGYAPQTFDNIVVTANGTTVLNPNGITTPIILQTQTAAIRAEGNR